MNETSASCTLLCAVEKPAGATLSWHKDGEIVKHSNSSLSLPLTIIRQEFSSSYTCEAHTSVEENHLVVTVTALCSLTSAGGQNKQDNSESNFFILEVFFVLISI